MFLSEATSSGRQFAYGAADHLLPGIGLLINICSRYGSGSSG
jgi:hypothetical protein